MKDFDAGRREYETAIKIIDTAEWKYKWELSEANRAIALAIMLEKKLTTEESEKKWENAIAYLKKSLKYQRRRRSNTRSSRSMLSEFKSNRQ